MTVRDLATTGAAIAKKKQPHFGYVLTDCADKEIDVEILVLNITGKNNANTVSALCRFPINKCIMQTFLTYIIINDDLLLANNTVLFIYSIA